MSRRIQQRRSRIHGNGVFAAADIPAGTRLIEYKGLRRSICVKSKTKWISVWTRMCELK